jgi:hypothetical protein
MERLLSRPLIRQVWYFFIVQLNSFAIFELHSSSFHQFSLY